MTWVAYDDLAGGQVVLEVDATAVRIFSSRSPDVRQVHLSQLKVTPSGPDRKGRHTFVLTARPHDAIRINLFPDPASLARVQAWLDVVARAQAALPPPLL